MSTEPSIGISNTSGNAVIRGPRRPVTPLPSKNCQNCNEPLVKRGKERPAEFRERLFCGKSCACSFKNNERHRLAGLRYCANHKCGEMLVRRPGEQHWRFIDRETCNKECSRAAANDTNSANPAFIDRSVGAAPIDGPSFFDQNVRLGPIAGRLPPKPFNYSPSGSSMGWVSSRSGDGAI